MASKTHLARVKAAKKRRLALAKEAGVDINDARAVNTFWLERLRRIVEANKVRINAA